MAWLGQECALGAVGGFGRVPGLGQLGVPFGQGAAGAAAFNRIADGALQNGGPHLPFDQIILGPFLHRRQGGCFVLKPAENHHRNGRRRLLHGTEGIEAPAVGELQVEEHDVDRLIGQPLQCRRKPLDMLDLEIRLPGVGQQLADEQGVVRAVFDEQNICSSRCDDQFLG